MKGLDPASIELFELLREYRQASPEKRPALCAAAELRYGAERTILIGDMAGFTRRVQDEGIVHYLSLIGEMRVVCEPFVQNCGGYLFKAEADNVFAAFFTPSEALDAACKIQQRLHELNSCCPEVDRVHLGLGLARGPVLAVGTDDAWGAAVNYASKLGEDLALSGDILAHESLEDTLRQMGLPLEELETDISNFRLRYFRVGWT